MSIVHVGMPQHLNVVHQCSFERVQVACPISVRIFPSERTAIMNIDPNDVAPEIFAVRWTTTCCNSSLLNYSIITGH